MTPTFHIPGLASEQAEERYRELAAGYQVPAPSPGQRPFRLAFHNPQLDKTMNAEVGKSLDPTWSTVVAILPGPPTVVVCENQHPHSFIVPAEHIIDVQMFSEGESTDTGAAA